MTSELMSLTWVTALTAVMWMPYILNMIVVRGLTDAVGYPDNPAPLAPWAQKMKAAHANAVENLVVFAALVLIADAAGVSNDTTVMASSVYFWRGSCTCCPTPSRCRGCGRSLSSPVSAARLRSPCSSSDAASQGRPAASACWRSSSSVQRSSARFSAASDRS